MKTEIFAYKNFIGALTDIDNGKFLNDPRGEGQIGCVVPVDEILITKEAKDLLLKAKREGGSFSPIMLIKALDGRCSIGLLGLEKHAYNADGALISRDCDLSVLDNMLDSEIGIPKDFIDYVDSVQ